MSFFLGIYFWFVDKLCIFLFVIIIDRVQRNINSRKNFFVQKYIIRICLSGQVESTVGSNVKGTLIQFILDCWSERKVTISFTINWVFFFFFFMFSKNKRDQRTYCTARVQVAVERKSNGRGKKNQNYKRYNFSRHWYKKKKKKR